MYIIVGLDNTISDDSWRAGKIDHAKEDVMARNNEYHLLSGLDIPGNEWIVQKNNYKLAILTARPKFYSPILLEWLHRNEITADCIIMREDHDLSSAADLKKKQLHALYKRMGITSSDIVSAFDDCKEVIEMYCKEGLQGHVMAIHKEHKNNDLYGKKA